MARAVLASLFLVMLVGGQVANAKVAVVNRAQQGAPMPPGDPTRTVPNRPPYGNVPTGLADYDVTTLSPALPVMPTLSMDTTMALIGLAPMINATWVQKVLPYIKGVDSTGLGDYLKPLIPPLQEIKPEVFGMYIRLLAKLDAKKLLPLFPAIAKLNSHNVARLVPAINAFDPKTVGKLGDLLTKLTPETYDALINMLNLGVPALNLMADKLNMLPIVMDVPAPAPFNGGSSA